jgi:hypothetical protein
MQVFNFEVEMALQWHTQPSFFIHFAENVVD